MQDLLNGFEQVSAPSIALTWIAHLLAPELRNSARIAEAPSSVTKLEHIELRRSGINAHGRISRGPSQARRDLKCARR